MAFDANTVRRDYGDPELEAYACRTDCALFDYAFIGRARLDGPGALDAIGELTRRPLAGSLPGRIRYALREDSSGHVLSDLTVWRHGETVAPQLTNDLHQMRHLRHHATNRWRIRALNNLI